MLLNRTKRELRRLNLRARKGLGQHFLIDEQALRRIVAAAELMPADVVVEVGPGLGILTRELAAQAGTVVAIEVDSKLASALKEALPSPSSVVVINEDVLQVEPVRLLETARVAPDVRYKVVANLPYYVASAVVRHFLESTAKPCVMVVTVQKEVAQQMVAPVGRMSLLSVSVQLYGSPEIVAHVPASGFHPRPKVDSAVVRIRVYDEPLFHMNEAAFFRLVRGGFAAPRKQLHNSLALGLGVPPGDAASLLDRAGIGPKRRAGTLSLEEWHRVYTVLNEER
ncbi:MAG: 16S rRNA (adenine(1518)-N(6)/adenine(1519)-N(6))-dimethyltransferase RsmA [Chloroflexota bacterium]|nr:16S rRNA (adenine(1518)-N(6)/adenine(1519)-N(6))-dimethyltransferase RsmA [Chloroflexota bacterium]